MTPAFVVAHRAAGRTRLRLAERLPADQAERQQRLLHDFAERLRGLLTDEHGLLRVDARPMTGSVVVDHPHLDADAVDTAIGAAGGELVACPATEPRPGLTPLLSSVHRADHSLREATDGAADLRTLMFLALTGLAIAQILRGQIMVPATSLLWYAFDVALHGGHAATDAPPEPGGD